MPGSLVTVATFKDVTAASFARMRLEADGIWCHIANEHGSIVEPLVVRALLQVRAMDAERAVVILKEPLIDEKAEDVPEDGPTCPRCTKQYAYPERVWWSVLAATLTFGRIAVRTRLCCRHCQFVWELEGRKIAGGPYRDRAR